MTDNVTRIGFTTGGINPYTGSTSNSNPKPAEDKEPTTPEGNILPQANPDSVYAFLASQAAMNGVVIDSPKTYDVNKYVTPEQAERIAGSVVDFENFVSENIDALRAEFGENLSDEALLALALGMVS